MSETERDTQGTVLVHCDACGTSFILRDKEPDQEPDPEMGNLCSDCRTLKSRYPDGFPPEVDAALILSRALCTLDDRLIDINLNLDRIADAKEDL